MRVKQFSGKPIMRTVAASIMVSLALTSAPQIAQAGLKDALNQMFISTSTETQAINTQRLRGIYGGSMSFRPVGRGIDIIQFAPPKINAGCGGVDLFFGSFSFINGEQFEQLIRSIAANAVGYAIKAAITAMCNPCAGILSDLEKAIRELNALAKNTCAIANAMFDTDAMDKVMESARNIGKHIKSAVGRAADATASENSSLSEKPSKTATGGGADTAEHNAKVGNLVHKAAKQTMKNGANTLKAFLSEEEIIQIVMSAFGTLIVPKESKPGACPAGTAPEQCSNGPEPWGPTFDQWDQFFNPKAHFSDGFPVHACQSSDCEVIAPGKISFAAWGGVKEIVYKGMFGVTDPHTDTNFTPDSLVGVFTTKSETAALSTHAKTLIKITPAPILNMLMEVQKIPGGPRQLGLQIAEMLPDFIAFQLGAELMTIGHNAFTAQNKADMPASYQNALMLKSKGLQQMRPDGDKLARIMIASVESIKAIQNLTNSRTNSGGAASK